MEKRRKVQLFSEYCDSINAGSKYQVVLKTSAFVLALIGETKHSDEQHSKLQNPLTSL